MTVSTESFAGANANPIAGNWTTAPGLQAFQRLSNVARGSLSSGNNAMYNTAVIPGNDQFCKMTLGLISGTGQDGGPSVRNSTSVTTFMCIAYNFSVPQVKFQKCLSGSFSDAQVQTLPGVLSVGDVMMIRVVGSRFQGLVNGTVYLDIVDTSITSGRLGAYCFQNWLGWSSFTGGDYVYQTAAPVSDVSNTGGWTPSTGVSLFAVVDETTADDSDYIASPMNPSSSSARLQMSTSVQTPEDNSFYNIFYRADSGGCATLVVNLYCGATLIKTWTHSNVPAGWTDYQQLLTSTEGATITVPTDLEIEIVATA